MVIYCIVTILLSAFILLCVFISNKDNTQNEIINISALENYIVSNIKNRKNKDYKVKNNPKTTNNQNKNENIKYIPLKTCKLLSQFKAIVSLKNPIYIERLCFQNNKNLLKIIPYIEKKINHNKTTYRSIKNECLIETVATSYAHAVLLKDNFNIFESFKSLTSLIKVYKKEAEILHILVISKLLKIYINLLKDITKIKRDVIKGGKVKRVNLSKISDAELYGIYLLNPDSTSVLINKNVDIVKATTNVLEELDDIYLRQKIIFKYIQFLSKGMR